MAKQPHCHRDGPRVEARETRGQQPAYGGANPRKRAPRGAVAAALVVLALTAVAAAVHPTPAAVVSADGPSAGRLAGPGDRLPNHILCRWRGLLSSPWCGATAVTHLPVSRGRVTAVAFFSRGGSFNCFFCGGRL